MQIKAHITTVSIEYGGSNLYEQGELGDTVLKVDSVAEFNQPSGICEINEVSYEYVVGDQSLEYDTLIISPGLPEGTMTGTYIYNLPKQPRRVATARVVSNHIGDQDEITATVVHGLAALLDTGLYEPGAEPVAVLEQRGEGQWWVVDLLSENPTLSQEVIDQIPLPDPSDGFPPESSPVPVAVGGDKVIYLSTEPVENTDPVTVRIYGSATPTATPEDTTLVGVVPNGGGLAVARVEGQPLAVGEPYYFKTIAFDADGDGPTSAEVSATPITMDYEEVLQQLQDDVAEADGKADTAQANAQTAIDDALAAFNKATSAEGLANTAQSTAESAETLASTADGKATTAQSTAENAATAASAAQGAAEAADTKADTAQSTAASAASAAATADGKATAAQSTATAAQSDADEALGTATAITRAANDLVLNGSAELLSDEYFSQFNLDLSDAPPGAFGSFWSTSSGPQGDQIIPINPSKKYRLSMSYRQRVPGIASRMYGMLVPYDGEGLLISPPNYMYVAGTLTTLAEDLNTGDTTITLTSAANWNNATQTYMRRLIFWDYVDGNGKAWPELTYSRNLSPAAGDLWAPGSISGNVITLRTPYNGLPKPAGTKLSAASSSGNYMYMPSISNIIPGDAWGRGSDTVGGINMTGNASTFGSGFPPGCTAVKVGALLNRDVAGGQHAIGGISLSDASAAQSAAEGAATAAGVAQSTANTAQTTASNAATAAATADGKAVAAQSAASAAASAATAAQGTADSKGRVIWTAAESALAANRNDKTLFIDTANGNVAKRWNGTAWIAVPDAAIQAAAQAAANAQAEAEDALDAATTAQTTANGKNRVRYGPTITSGTPTTPAGTVDGDLYFGRSGTATTQQWRRVGSSWVQETVDGAVLSNLDAGTITAGFLDVANRVEAGAITTPLLAAESITAEKVSSEVIVANEIYSRDGLRIQDGSGAGFSFLPSSGFQQTGLDGNTRVHFPQDPGQPNSINAELYTQGLTVEGRAAFRGNENEISRASSITMATGTTAPTTGVSVSQGWERMTTGGHIFASSRRGYWQKHGTVWYSSETTQGAGSYPRAHTYNEAGEFAYKTMSGLPSGRNWQGGCLVKRPSGGWSFFVSTNLVSEGGFGYVHKHYYLSDDFSTSSELTPVNLGTQTYPFSAVVFDNRFVIIRTIGNWDTGYNSQLAIHQLSGAVDTSHSPITMSSYMMKLCLAGDINYSDAFPGTNIGLDNIFTVYTQDTSGDTSHIQAWIVDTGVDMAFRSYGMDFYTPAGSPGWDGSSVYAMGSDGMFQGSDNLSQREVFSAYTWYDSDTSGGTHETPISSVTRVLQPARSGLQFTTPPPADDGSPNAPNSIKLYLGDTESSLHYKGTATNSLFLLNFDLTSGAAPPTTNTFPESTAGKIQSADGSAYFAGDGNAVLPSLENRVTDRSNHHGTQSYTSIEDLDDWAAGVPLSDFASPNALIHMGGQRVTGVANPTSATDAVNREYIRRTYEKRYRSTTQSVATTVWVTSLLNMAEVDDPNIAYNASTGIFTVNRAGVYFISYTVYWTQNNSGTRAARIHKTGSVQIAYDQTSWALTPSTPGFTISCVDAFDVGDTFVPQSYQNSGSTLSLFDGIGLHNLAVARIGE